MTRGLELESHLGRWGLPVSRLQGQAWPEVSMLARAEDWVGVIPGHWARTVPTFSGWGGVG